MSQKGLTSLLLQVAGAIVFAIIVTVFIIELAGVFYSKPEEDGRGYKIDIANTPAATATTASSAGAAAGAPPTKVDITPYLAKADLKLGAQIIKRCQACHSFEKGKPGMVGPNQYNLVGRKTASVEGFDYSDAMKAKGGTWTFQALSDFLTSPQQVVPGTKMGFPGLARPEERAAIIMYINQTYSDKPLEVK